MAYQAEISRKNPGCFLFLVDQSESMEDPFGGGEAGRRKAEELATILNKLIHNLCIRCSKSDSIYDYFHVGVLGYSEDSCKPALSGEDGSVLLFNIHLSSTAGPSIELPGNGKKLPDQHAKQLFEPSSTLTPFMVARATELGMPAEENSRGFIFNAQPLHVIHFLDIGTRPANVHLR